MQTQNLLRLLYAYNFCISTLANYHQVKHLIYNSIWCTDAKCNYLKHGLLAYAEIFFNF